MNFQSSNISIEDSMLPFSNLSYKSNSKSVQKFSKKWTLPENILYARYLKTHMGQMNNQKKKKSGKFTKMSNFIGSKSQNQCRSHHQKMLLTFKSIQNIIKYVTEVKKRGKLISIQEFQQVNVIGLQFQNSNLNQSKIEEQISTQKQSQQEIKKENYQELKQKPQHSQLISNFSLNQEQSQIVDILGLEKDIFNVLNIDQVQKYSELFTI